MANCPPGQERQAEEGYHERAGRPFVSCAAAKRWAGDGSRGHAPVARTWSRRTASALPAPRQRRRAAMPDRSACAAGRRGCRAAATAPLEACRRPSRSGAGEQTSGDASDPGDCRSGRPRRKRSCASPPAEISAGGGPSTRPARPARPGRPASRRIRPRQGGLWDRAARSAMSRRARPVAMRVRFPARRQPQAACIPATRKRSRFCPSAHGLFSTSPAAIGLHRPRQGNAAPRREGVARRATMPWRRPAPEDGGRRTVTPAGRSDGDREAEQQPCGHDHGRGDPDPVQALTRRSQVRIGGAPRWRAARIGVRRDTRRRSARGGSCGGPGGRVRLREDPAAGWRTPPARWAARG